MDAENAESVDDDNEVERLNRLQVACALRDTVGDFIAGSCEEEASGVMTEVLQFASQRITLKKIQIILLHRRPQETAGAVAACEQTFCGHECAHHTALMNPELWGNLPSEILHLIFARLPLPDVLNVVPELSKEWKQRMEEKSPEFQRILADASPKMFGLIAQNMKVPGKFWLRVYDLGSTTWHMVEIVVNGNWERFNTMHATDGGWCASLARCHRGPETCPLLLRTH